MRCIYADSDFSVHEVPGKGHVIVPKKNFKKWHKAMQYVPGALALSGSAYYALKHGKDEQGHKVRDLMDNNRSFALGLLSAPLLAGGAAAHGYMGLRNRRRAKVRKALDDAPHFRGLPEEDEYGEERSTQSRKDVNIVKNPEGKYYFVPKGHASIIPALLKMGIAGQHLGAGHKGRAASWAIGSVLSGVDSYRANKKRAVIRKALDELYSGKGGDGRQSESSRRVVIAGIIGG